MTRPAGVLALAIGVCVALPAFTVASSPVEAREQRPSLFGKQIRMPWDQPRRPGKRPRGKASPAAQREARPPRDAAPHRRGQPGTVAPPMVAQPAEELLPAPGGPPTLEPRARTKREADEWRAFAAEVAAPQAPPPVSADGPAPAPANVLALYVPRPVTATTTAPAPTPEPRSLPERAATPMADAPLPPLPPQRPEDDDSPDASASDVPLPPRRPGEQMTSLPPGPEARPEPEAPAIAFPALAREDDPDCQALDREDVVLSKPMAPIEGPGVCGAPAPVSMTGVRLADGGVVEIRPAATLRCAMARAVATYVREDLAPAAVRDGEALSRIVIAGSFMCRGRNGAAGGKMSEHGRANAMDISGLTLKGGREFGIYAKDMPQTLRREARSGACDRFDTVLGEGSDGHHEDHLHIDLQPRRSKAKLCQWNDPAPDVARAPDAGSAPEAERDAKDERPSRHVDGLEPEKPLLEPERPLKASARKRGHAPASLSRPDKTP